jgi:hypothetical protein
MVSSDLDQEGDEHDREQQRDHVLGPAAEPGPRHLDE